MKTILQSPQQKAAVEIFVKDDLLTVICFDSRVDTVVASQTMDEVGPEEVQWRDKIRHRDRCAVLHVLPKDTGHGNALQLPLRPDTQIFSLPPA